MTKYILLILSTIFITSSSWAGKPSVTRDQAEQYCQGLWNRIGHVIMNDPSFEMKRPEGVPESYYKAAESFFKALRDPDQKDAQKEFDTVVSECTKHILKQMNEEKV